MPSLNGGALSVWTAVIVTPGGLNSAVTNSCWFLNIVLYLLLTSVYFTFIDSTL